MRFSAQSIFEELSDRDTNPAPDRSNPAATICRSLMRVGAFEVAEMDHESLWHAVSKAESVMEDLEFTLVDDMKAKGAEITCLF